MSADRWTPPGYYVNGSATEYAGPCAHCGQAAGEHLLWQGVAFCTSPPLELQGPAREDAA